MEQERTPSLLNVNICGFPNILDPWDLIRWITLKFLAGSQLTATAVYFGKRISGQLKPHSLERTQQELARSCLVDLLTEKGTFTFNCKHIIDINTL
jgi:hypothetical protein